MRRSSRSAASTSWPRPPPSSRPTRPSSSPTSTPAARWPTPSRRSSSRPGRRKHPGAVTVMYVNTTAEVKALTDYCVTSSNAVSGRRAHPARARAGHRDPLRPRHVPRRLRREAGRALAAHLGRRVPRPRGHPPGGHHGDPRGPPGRRLPHPPRVRLLDVGHGVRRRGRRRLRGRPHALHGRDARLRARARRPRRHRDHGDGDRHAPPACARRRRTSSSSPRTSARPAPT